MANDLLSVKNGRYSHVFTNAEGVTNKVDVLLDESDPLWPALRHLHISDAINLVLDEFNSFVKDNKVSRPPRARTPAVALVRGQLAWSVKGQRRPWSGEVLRADGKLRGRRPRW